MWELCCIITIWGHEVRDKRQTGRKIVGETREGQKRKQGIWQNCLQEVWWE